MSTIAAKRRCSCGAFLRDGNHDDTCGPCQVRERRREESLARQLQAQPQREAILSLLPGKVPEIAAQVGATRKRVDKSLRNMMRQGRVTRTGTPGRGCGRARNCVGGYVYRRTDDVEGER